MGGAVSELRGEIHVHVLITQHYPQYLEPYLAAIQYFLRTAESGEGTAKDRPIDELPVDVVITNKRIFEETSTEVELLCENSGVMKSLLQAIETHKTLMLSPKTDPFKRWYDLPFRIDRPMPKFVEVAEREVPRFRIAVLRSAIRCIRLMMFCTEGKLLLESLNGPDVLNTAQLDNPLDDYVKNDVKAIFSMVYGGDNAVKRIAIGNVPVVVEMMKENPTSAIVQLAGVQRLCKLLHVVSLVVYTPTGSSPVPEDPLQATSDVEAVRVKLINDLETYNVVPLVTETLRRFDVDQYLALYVHVAQFISFVAAISPENTKLVGLHGGIEGSIRLLFKARTMQRINREAEREEANRQAQFELLAKEHDWLEILEKPKAATSTSGSSSTKQGAKYQAVVGPAQPAEILADGSEKITSLSSLAVVDFTPTEVGQLAIWALDLLATLEYNVSMMKEYRLKYILEEIRLDPEHRAFGKSLIMTRRLRLIRWDEIERSSHSRTSPPASPLKGKGIKHYTT